MQQVTLRPAVPDDAAGLLAITREIATERIAKVHPTDECYVVAEVDGVIERMGYVVEGVQKRPFLIKGEYVDDIIMAKWLKQETEK